MLVGRQRRLLCSKLTLLLYLLNASQQCDLTAQWRKVECYYEETDYNVAQAGIVGESAVG